MDAQARKREIEIDLKMLESQLAGGQALAPEVRSHLLAKRSALEVERARLDTAGADSAPE